MKFEKGQSLVESALGFIIFIMIVGGIIDLGRLYFVSAAMEDAVGDAALYFSVFPDCVDVNSGPQCGNPENATYRAKAFKDGLLADLSNSTVILSCYDLATKEPLDCVTEATASDVVQVDMYYNFELLGFTIPEINGATNFTLHSSATQIIIAP